jgi:hypothetical protein
VRTRLWLVKNGVPWGEAWALDEVEAAAFAVVFGEQESGRRYSWGEQKYVERE